jgi:hypothetical protein
MVFEVTRPAPAGAGEDVVDRVDPVWIYPTFRSVATWFLVAVAAAGLVVLAVYLLRRVHRQVQLMRMSPRERALKELERLLARDLVGKNRVKAFYLELTMIVRRYIERAHAIRAPEQTTEEFLAAVADRTNFSRDVVATLKAFLQAADLVKFAAHRPPRDDIDRATDTARTYIVTDAATEEAPENE